MTTQERLEHALANPLTAGYVTHAGHVMTAAECESYNRYTSEAARPGISSRARNFLLDQRQRFFTSLCASHEG